MNTWTSLNSMHTKEKRKNQNGNSEIFREFPYQKKIKFQEILPINAYHWLSEKYAFEWRAKISEYIRDIIKKEWNFV